MIPKEYKRYEIGTNDGILKLQRAMVFHIPDEADPIYLVVLERKGPLHFFPYHEVNYVLSRPGPKEEG